MMRGGVGLGDGRIRPSRRWKSSGQWCGIGKGVWQVEFLRGREKEVEFVASCILQQLEIREKLNSMEMGLARLKVAT